MQFNIQLTAGQRDTLKALLYDQTQVPTIMNPAMARAIYEEIDRADRARKLKRRDPAALSDSWAHVQHAIEEYVRAEVRAGLRADVGANAQDGRQTRPATPDSGQS